MKIKKSLCLVLMATMIFSTPVMAAESGDSKMNEESAATVVAPLSEEEAGAMLEEVPLTTQAPEEMGKEEVTALFEKQNDVFRSYVTTPDPYEPNDTPATAYPYNSVNTITTELSSQVDLYTLGMKNAGLHSATDEDWYTISLQSGTDYFVDLRNIGMRNWYIELYYLRADGTGYYYTTDDPVYENQPERYFYFTAEDSGTFYIRVTSGGDWVDSMYYFFYVGPAIQYYNISDLPTYGNTQIFGTGYQTYSCDLRNYVPKDTALLTLSLTNNFIEGTPCNELDKRISAGGSTYYNTPGTGSETINNIAGAALGQLWIIGGKCAKGSEFCRWSAHMNGRFACIMAPYPGDELVN